LVRIISGSLIEFKGQSVDDGMAVDVVDGSSPSVPVGGFFEDGHLAIGAHYLGDLLPELGITAPR
jgi:hypothetical protein